MPDYYVLENTNAFDFVKNRSTTALTEPVEFFCVALAQIRKVVQPKIPQSGDEVTFDHCAVLRF